jgi:hypothetical protein
LRRRPHAEARRTLRITNETFLLHGIAVKIAHFSLAILAQKCYITTNGHKIRHKKDRNSQLKNASGVFKQ